MESMTTWVLATIVLSATAASGAELADDWCGALWRRSDYHGFAMQENWHAAMLETGQPHAAGASQHKTAKSAKAAGVIPGNPTGKRVHRKTPVDDGAIPPNVIAPVR